MTSTHAAQIDDATAINLPDSIDPRNPEDLYEMIFFAAQTKLRKTDGMQTLRAIARVVMRAKASYIAHDDLLIVLASAVMHDHLPGLASEWHPVNRQIDDLAWHMCSSPLGLKNTLMAPYGRNATLDDHLEAAKAYLEREREKIRIKPDEAHQIIQEEVGRVSALYPEIGLSFGYIGNIWHSPYQDDRSFRIFTKLRTETGLSISFGGHSYNDLGMLAYMTRAGLEEWAAKLAKQQKGS